MFVCVFSNFEITVNGTLVHSKKTKGDGFLNETNQAKVDKVIAEISFVFVISFFLMLFAPCLCIFVIL